jgi:type I restriction enzyme, S subunit
MVGEALPDGWHLTKLGDLGEVNRGRSRHRPRYAEHLYGGPYPFIQTGDIKNSGGRITSYQQTYSKAGLAQSRLWPAGTMCITIAANIAETGVLTFPACFPDSVVGFIADKSKCDIRFIEYTFRSLRREIQHQASGSVQNNINLETLARLRFALPPLTEQFAIAQVLCVLDDKIELNQRMNETLEAVTRALFKSWFVDFNPTRAKSEGRDTGLPSSLANLFPGRAENTALGGIPVGWIVSSVDDEFDLTMGQSPPGDTYNDSGHGLPFFQGSTDFGFRYPTRRIYCTAPTRFAKAGDTLISVRAPVGDINMAKEDCAIGRGVAAARHKTGSRSYTYQFARSIADVFSRFDGEGTVFGSIGKKDFRAIECVRVPAEVVEAYELLMRPVDDRINIATQGTASLVAIRDALLPRLISGEIRVRDAEKIVGAAI